MALWGKTDTKAAAPKYLSEETPATMQTDKDNAFFVDTTEAGVAGNRAKGLKTPGWNLYKEYGTGRKYVETLVPMKVTAVAAGDAGVTNNTATEDATVADRRITISAQPANATRVAPNTAQFSVTAAATPTASLSYQWQVQQSGTGAWINVPNGTGGTTATYTTPATTSGVITPPDTTNASNGDKYRVIVSASGAVSVTSNAATLTVTA